MVASTAIAVAIPIPTIFTTTDGSNENPMNTATMISAALVITRAVDDKPATTAPLASPVLTQCSRIQDSKKTS